MPADLEIGDFVTIYKNKGSKDDMSKYRFLCMLNHAYKMLSSYLLLWMLKDIEGFLTETQAGFRKDWSSRDNVFILATLIDKVLTTQERCTICFIDFVAAFDTVSHHFLDEALGYATEHAMMETECAEKCRAISGPSMLRQLDVCV